MRSKRQLDEEARRKKLGEVVCICIGYWGFVLSVAILIDYLQRPG
jgi:hypothetical protein